jgi:hypothetical protein
MSTFPTLKTGAAAQFPAKRTVRYQNESHRFLDGTEQRYRDCAGPLLQWEFQLSQLDEGEMAAFEEFFVNRSGAFACFPFTDPWSGATYETCSLGNDELDTTTLEEMNGSTILRVTENR